MSAQLLDPYERPARLYPALLAAAPLCMIVWATYKDNDLLLAATSSLVVLAVAAFALSRIARNAGKRIQRRVFQSWGGAPTVQLLRHRNDHFDRYTKARYHAVIAARLGHALPTAEEEAADSTAADEVYRAATTLLIGATRDRKRFPLVFKENVAYGFHRNALGLRSWGLFSALLCLVWALLQTGALRVAPARFDATQVFAATPSVHLSILFALVMIVGWVWWFGEQALKHTAFAYAERLIHSCDQLTT